MTDAWGIVDGFWDTKGTWHHTAPATRGRLPPGDERRRRGAPGPPPMWFVRTGQSSSLWNPCDLVLEDGTVLERLEALPPDLPIGYHELRPLRRHARRPGSSSPPGVCRCPSGAGAGRRSSTRCGRRPAGASATWATWPRWPAGARRSAPAAPHQPTARRRGHAAPAAQPLLRHQPPLPPRAGHPRAARPRGRRGARRRAGRAWRRPAARSTPRARIDRDAVARVKMPALAPRPRTLRAPARAIELIAFEAWRAEQGTTSSGSPPAAALSERHGPVWTRWPDELRRPDGVGVAAAAAVADAAASRSTPGASGCSTASWPGRGQRRRHRRRPGRRVRLGRLRRLARPGPAGARLPVGAPPDTFNADGPGLGPAAVHAVEAARRPLPTVRRRRAGQPAPPRRAAHRPRDGPVPPLLDPRGRRRPEGTYVRYPATTCSTSWRSRPPGPAPSSWARTSARSRTRCATTLRTAGCCRAAVLWFEEPAPTRLARAAPWPPSPPTTCPRSPACGRATTSARLAAGLAEDPGATDWFRSRITQATGLAETAEAARRGGHARRPGRLAGPRAPGHPRRRLRRAGASEPAGHPRRAPELAPPAAAHARPDHGRPAGAGRGRRARHRPPAAPTRRPPPRAPRADRPDRGARAGPPARPGSPASDATRPGQVTGWSQQMRGTP